MWFQRFLPCRRKFHKVGIFSFLGRFSILLCPKPFWLLLVSCSLASQRLVRPHLLLVQINIAVATPFRVLYHFFSNFCSKVYYLDLDDRWLTRISPNWMKILWNLLKHKDCVFSTLFTLRLPTLCSNQTFQCWICRTPEVPSKVLESSGGYFVYQRHDPGLCCSLQFYLVLCGRHQLFKDVITKQIRPISMTTWWKT